MDNTKTREKPKHSEVWQHSSGIAFWIIGVCEHTETGEEYVVCKNLRTRGNSARTMASFMREIDRDKHPDNPAQYRFTKLTKKEKKWFFRKKPKEMSINPIQEATGRALPNTQEIWRHFKQKSDYLIMTCCYNPEEETRFVAYTRLSDGKSFIRQTDMFMSEVDHEKYPKAAQKWRFEKVL